MHLKTLLEKKEIEQFNETKVTLRHICYAIPVIIYMFILILHTHLKFLISSCKIMKMLNFLEPGLVLNKPKSKQIRNVNSYSTLITHCTALGKIYR